MAFKDLAKKTGRGLAVATAVLAAGLAWHILHPPPALSPATGGLQPDVNSAPK